MKRKIHIGYVVLRMDVGGVERSIARLLDGLPKERYRCSLICLDRSGKAMEWVENKEVEVIELKKSPGWDLRAIGRLSQVIRTRQIDIIQSHNWGTLFESTWANRTKLARHIHAERGTVLGPPSKSRLKTVLKAQLMRRALQRVDAVMSNAYATAEKVRTITKLPNLPIEVIPNGLVNPYSHDPLDDPRWLEIRSKTRDSLGVLPSDLLLGVVGRLSPVKNFELALRGFAALLLSPKDFVANCNYSGLQAAQRQMSRSWLVLVGDGPCRESLENLARELGISDSVRFVGEQNDAWPYYAAMDIFLSTSHSEGMSQSILEAMASGKAIVATDVGDSRRMIGCDRAGRIMDEASPALLSSKIHELKINDLERKSLGAYAYRNYLARYSLASMLGSFDRLYASLTDPTAPRL